MKSSLRRISLGTSIAVLLICLVLVTGSTFSLFTSNSKVDISVTSGTVDVDAIINESTLKTWSRGETEEEARTDGTFANDGSLATIEDGKLVLTNITPGDNTKVTVDVTNNSSVAVAYRLVLTINGELADALDITIKTPAGDFEYGYTKWITVDAGEEIGDIDVKVSFPEAENDNDYQGLECSISFVLEAVQSNGDFVDPITYNEETGVYEVNSEEGMMLMSNIISTVSHGEGRSLKFAFTADMDMSGYVWAPIDAMWVTIDGQGHTVSNLNCGITDWGRSGFLGYLGGATLKNIALENVTAVGTQAGVVAGCLEGVTLSDVTIKGTNTVTYDVTKNPEETWGGVGAIAGVTTSVKAAPAVVLTSTSDEATYGVTIAEGATISVDYNGLKTEAPIQDEYSFNESIASVVTNNGTVTTTGTPIIIENGLQMVYGENGEKTLYLVPADYAETTVNVPEGVTTIGGYAFAHNSNIEEIILPSTVTTLNDRAFRDTSASTVVLNEGLTNISYQAFRNASNVTTVVIPSTVTTISKEAFQNSGIKSITVPATVTEIAYGGFRDMKVLETVVIEGNVNVPVYAFRACTNLKTVIICGDDITFGGNETNPDASGMIFTNKENGDGSAITVYVTNETVKERLLAADTAAKDYGGYDIVIVNGAYSDEDVTNLDSALQGGDDVVLTEDIKFSASDTTANSGYGATGVLVDGGTLDGNGNTLTVNNAWTTWDCAVNIKSGTIKNLTIDCAMRGIFMGSANGDVYIDNVIIDGTVYTFNSDGGNKEYGVYISNSTLNGWTSFSDVHKEVVFTNCTLGEGSGYAFCRPYNAPTKFENCVFDEGFKFDTSCSSEIVFTNCYYGETLITAENAATLGNGDTTFFYNGLNGITINDVKVDDVTNNEELKAAIVAGVTNVVLVAGDYTMPDGSDLSLQGKTLTIIGDENTVIDVSGIDERDQFVTGATLVFDGVTLNFGTANYMGFANATELVYKNCTINGLQFLYGPSVTFKNCVLNSNGAEHCVWTWGVQNVSFTDCDFTYGDRAVNCYGEGVTTNASFTNCTFTKVEGKETTGAIETNSSTLTALNLTINNCTVNEGKLWFIPVWDTLYGEKTVTTVDGVRAVASNKQLSVAVAAGETNILLAEGEYDLNGNQKDGLTLIGVGENVKMANTTQYASGKATGAIWKAINLKNMTITNTVYTMADGGKATFTNVNFAAGFRQGYGTGVVFTECTFGSNSEGYALHFQTDSASEGGLITLDGCEFEGGKVHLGGKRAYKFVGCDFAAGTDFQVWSNITLDGCTVDGVAVTADNIATLFPNLDLEKVTLK